MHEKTHRIQAKLNDKDYELFQTNLKKTCLTAGTYIHYLMHGNKIVECPSIDLRAILRELQKTSNSINKIAMFGKWNENDLTELRGYVSTIQHIISDIITGDIDWKIQMKGKCLWQRKTQLLSFG